MITTLLCCCIVKGDSWNTDNFHYRHRICLTLCRKKRASRAMKIWLKVRTEVMKAVWVIINHQDLKLGRRTNSPQSRRSSHGLPRCAETLLLTSPSSTRFSASARSSRVTSELRQHSLTKLFRSSSRNRRGKTCWAAGATMSPVWSLPPVTPLINHQEVTSLMEQEEDIDYISYISSQSQQDGEWVWHQ